MALRPPYDDADPSHRLYHGPGVRNRDAFAAENAVVRAAFEFVDRAHVSAGVDALADDAPVAGRAFRSLTPVADDERALYGGEERVGRVPGDADAVRGALGDPFDPDDTLNWRAFDVDAVLVRAGGTPRYHSVPHEFHVREVYGADAPAYRDAVRDAIRGIDGVALYPVDPLVEWRVRETRYEVTPTALRYSTAGGEWTDRSLGRLAAVGSARGGRGLDCEWRSRGAAAGDSIQRALGRLADRVGGEPPGTVPTDGGETTTAVLDALADLSESLGYDIDVSRDG